MITHDSRFEELASAPVKTINVRFDDMTDTSGDHDFSSSDDLMSATQTALGRFLGVATKKMEAKCLEDWTAVRDHEYDVYMGIWDDVASDWNEIYLGRFGVDTADYDVDAGSTLLTMYDRLGKATQEDYSLVDADFPCTVEELAGKIATALDVTLEFDTDLPNADYEVLENLWKTITGTKMYDIVKEIAEVTATTALMSGNTLTFRPYAVDSEVMTEDNLSRFKIGQHWGVLNSVVLSRQPQNDNVVLTNEPSVAADGLTDWTAVNNQIVDDLREELIVPMYDFLVGETPYIVQDDIEAVTEGHGWYEIGDPFTMTIGGNDYYPILTEIILILEGSIDETIKSKIPDPNDIDYASAGGIQKTIWNTEIKVNKQANEITSIVSRQDETDEQFTEIVQQIDNIATTVQGSGGNNLLENSVGYSVLTDGSLEFWDFDGTGAVTSQSSPGSQNYGATSGNEIDLSGSSGKITQRVTVAPNNPYSLSFLAKKNSSGSATIRLFNDDDEFEIELAASTAYAWEQFKLENIVPTGSYLDVEIQSNSADNFSITDLMLNVGEYASVWSQAADEVTSQNVIINRNGITVKSNLYADYTNINPLEFAGYSDASGTMKKVFSLNRDITIMEKLQANSEISMEPIKIVPITDGDNAGWAFVKLGS